jgi:hypothetical protein
MADEIEFVNGLIVKAPHERAPDFVKASISIKVADLAEWLRSKSGEEWVNVDVKVAKSGKWYASVSNFKPKEGNPKEELSAPNQERSALRLRIRGRTSDKFADMDSDIPF